MGMEYLQPHHSSEESDSNIIRLLSMFPKEIHILLGLMKNTFIGMCCMTAAAITEYINHGGIDFCKFLFRICCRAAPVYPIHLLLALVAMLAPKPC